MPEPTMLIGLGLGLFLGLIYLWLCYNHRRNPDLSRFLTLVLATVAVVSAFDFGFNAATADLSALPYLARQRLIMVLGSIAVVWLGVRETWKVLRSALEVGKAATAAGERDAIESR